MQFRTDLAIESTECESHTIKGLIRRERKCGSLTVTEIRIETEEAAHLTGKPKGKYITAEGLPMTDHFRDVKAEIECLAAEIGKLIPPDGEILAAGLGNTEITSDALGPQSMKYILATRHITGEYARIAGLERLRSVSVIAPGVLGQTGIEVCELLRSIVQSIRPKALIVIDALAARELSRLGCTVQISNTGIVPGSGVGNKRQEISEKSIGIPVIAVGVPTVVDAVTLAYDILGQTAENGRVKGEGMIVTPKEIDLLIERAAKLTGMAVNRALQREYDFDTLSALVS